MWLRSIPENIRTQYLWLTKNYNNIKNPQKQSVLSLSSSEQLILCFADLWRKDTARMEQIVFQDQYTLIPKVYAESHHTDPDTPTRIKMKVAYGKFIYGIS